MRCLVSILLLLLTRVALAQDVLLVIQEPAGLRVGPAAHMPVMETLPAGSVLQAVERSGGWYRVRADRAVEGWVPVLATRRLPLPGGVERDSLSALSLERILTARPRLEEAAALSPQEPSRYELRDFAHRAHLAPGRVR